MSGQNSYKSCLQKMLKFGWRRNTVFKMQVHCSFIAGSDQCCYKSSNPDLSQKISTHGWWQQLTIYQRSPWINHMRWSECPQQFIGPKVWRQLHVGVGFEQVGFQVEWVAGYWSKSVGVRWSQAPSLVTCPSLPCHTSLPTKQSPTMPPTQ